MATRVILADDHTVIRQGLRSLIDKQDGMQVVGGVSNGREAIRLVKKLLPNVVVMDISMPELNGVEATRQIKAIDDQIKVLALSMHSDKRFITGMLDAGASGYLLKDCAVEELATAIRTVASHQTYLSPAIAGTVVQSSLDSKQPNPKSGLGSLTARQREVLQLLSEGYSTKQIALRLNVSVKTVETHRNNVMSRLQLHNVADLTKYAIREGLTSLEP